MASFGRSMEKLAGAIADFGEGLNQRLDENHLVDMLIELKDEEVSVSEFEAFTESIQALRKGKRSTSATSSTTATA